MKPEHIQRIRKSNVNPDAFFQELNHTEASVLALAVEQLSEEERAKFVVGGVKGATDPFDITKLLEPVADIVVDEICTRADEFTKLQLENPDVDPFEQYYSKPHPAVFIEYYNRAQKCLPSVLAGLREELAKL